MSRIVVLDAAPLGLLSAPVKKGGEPAACSRWLDELLAAGVRLLIPEIADYEVRREFIRAGKAASVAKLDGLATTIQYLPLSTAAMRMAADLWAKARMAGKPTASETAIDADVILAAQALTFGIAPVVVATSNAGHLSRYITAQDWKTITG